jgi:hypothetical protein
MRAYNFKDETGNKYGRLTVIEEAEKRGKQAWWRCKCECGNETEVCGAKLRNGHTRSCGCLQKDVAAERLTTHGMSNSATRNSWRGMMERCTNSNNIGYENYGARGITVCERWHKFENFLEDMGRRPDGLTLERIDNSKGYSPDNCRWATRKEQNNNRRDNRILTYNGISLTIPQWAEKLGVSKSALYNRVYSLGWSIERTLTTPVRPMRHRKTTAPSAVRQ